MKTEQHPLGEYLKIARSLLPDLVIADIHPPDGKSFALRGSYRTTGAPQKFRHRNDCGCDACQRPEDGIGRLRIVPNGCSTVGTLSRRACTLGAGVSVRFNPMWRPSVNYDAELRGSDVGHFVSGVLRANWEKTLPIPRREVRPLDAFRLSLHRLRCLSSQVKTSVDLDLLHDLWV